MELGELANYEKLLTKINIERDNWRKPALRGMKLMHLSFVCFFVSFLCFFVRHNDRAVTLAVYYYTEPNTAAGPSHPWRHKNKQL